MLQFRLVGPVEVERDGAPVVIGGARRRAVLAILLLEAGRVVPVDRLIDGVWGEAPPETAATALRAHLTAAPRAWRCDRHAAARLPARRRPGEHRYQALCHAAR